MPIGFTSSQTIGNFENLHRTSTPVVEIETKFGDLSTDEFRLMSLSDNQPPNSISHDTNLPVIPVHKIFFLFSDTFHRWTFYSLAALSCKLESHLSSTSEHRFCTRTRNAKKANKYEINNKDPSEEKFFCYESNAINFITHLHQVPMDWTSQLNKANKETRTCSSLA